MRKKVASGVGLAKISDLPFGPTNVLPKCLSHIKTSGLNMFVLFWRASTVQVSKAVVGHCGGAAVVDDSRSWGTGVKQRIEENGIGFRRAESAGRDASTAWPLGQHLAPPGRGLPPHVQM